MPGRERERPPSPWACPLAGACGGGPAKGEPNLPSTVGATGEKTRGEKLRWVKREAGGTWMIAGGRVPGTRNRRATMA